MESRLSAQPAKNDVTPSNACRANDDEPPASGNIEAPSAYVFAVRANRPPANRNTSGVRPSPGAATRPGAEAPAVGAPLLVPGTCGGPCGPSRATVSAAYPAHERELASSDRRA